MDNTVIIVSSAHNFDALRKKFGDVAYMAADYNTYETLREYNVSYLYKESTNSEQELRSIYKVSLNWHRDSNGSCLIATNGITYGPVIARSVISSFANDYRNYLAIKSLFEKFVTVFINKNSILSFHRTSVVFEDKIHWYETDDEIDILCTSSPIRTVINDYPVIHPLSKYARFAQKILLPFLKSRKLIWPDWSYASIFKSKKGCLYLNSFNLWRGCYLSESTKYINEAKDIFPDNILPEVISVNRIMKKLTELDVGWDKSLIRLYIATIIRIYKDCHLKLRRSYSIYKELFYHYGAKSIVFPGETHFAYLIAVQLAKTLKIKTALVLDGYPTVKDESSYFYMAKKGEYSFDKYVAYGVANRDLMHKYEYLPKEKIVLAQSPLVNLVKKHSSNGGKKYVLVVAYTPKQHNPQARWDKRIKISHDIISCLIDTGETNILIKIKSGAGSESEHSHYEQYFRRHDLLDKVSIVSGELNEFVSSAKYIVGQLSTSLFESIIAETPYYIYEPYEAGLPNSSIASVIVVKSKTISRTLYELRFTIKNSLSFKHEYFSYVVDGPCLGSIPV